MTLFRPCIDLHQGQVKQIVGKTLDARDAPVTNFVSSRGAAYYAAMYRRDGLEGGHVIMLGPGNETAAQEALAAWPGGLQVGGGIALDTAQRWLDAGAGKVIVTSWLFPDGRFDSRRAAALADAVGVDRVVIDLSCRRTDAGYVVAMNKWQRLTDTRIDAATLRHLASFCSEFLVHAADVEGSCSGVDTDLVRLLADASPVPCTYAGGAASLEDLEKVAQASDGRIDLTFGSALDIFGGQGVRYADCVAWNRKVTDRR